MSGNLLSFMQSLVGGLPANLAEETPEEIAVQGASPRRKITPDDRSAPSARFMDELIPREGMFGIKGTARNILGTVGDAFLVQSGNKAMYAPQREKEKQGSALYDFTSDPLKAIERLAATGNIEAAQTLYNNYSDYEAKKATLESTQGKELDDRYQQYSGLFGQLAGAANEQTYERLKPALMKYKERGGLGDEFVIPSSWAEAAPLFEGYKRGAMKATQQVNSDLGEKRIEQTGVIADKRIKSAEEIAAANRAAQKVRNDDDNATQLKTDNPPPRKTVAQEDAEILAKVRDGTATPREVKIYNERLKRSRKTSPLDLLFSDDAPRTPPKSGGKKLVIRGGKPVAQ